MNLKSRIASTAAGLVLACALVSGSANYASAAAGPAGSAAPPAATASSSAGAPAAASSAAPPMTTGAPAAPGPAAASASAATGAGSGASAAPASASSPGDAPPPAAEPQSGDFKTLDQEVQGMKKDVIDLNKDLFVLEEELLFPANTQVAVYVSMDVGTFFALDSVTLKIDNKQVKNYLYTAREADALLKGGVQQIYLGNLKVGKHELVAFFTGKGPIERDYRRGATINFDKGVGAKYLELKITDKVAKHQPEFLIKDWE
jgi:hypothetical protein